MTGDENCVSALLPDMQVSPITTECWLRVADADYRLCRAFAQRFGARLHRSLRSQRVGWETFGHAHCAVLLPNSASLDCLVEDEWYFYYVSGESLFRRTRAQREQQGIILLAESVDDWGELLRQALQEQVFDVRYTITPDYVNALGETEHLASGFVFALESYAAQAVSAMPLRITGAGDTPEQAAREACRCWLRTPAGCVSPSV